MIRFELPSLGADMDEGTLLTWLVKPGDPVKRGQVLAVVDTSKAAVDVEIWHDGTVAELLVQPGEQVPVGTVLATLLEAGERDGASPQGPAASPGRVPPTPFASAAASADRTPAATSPTVPVSTSPTTSAATAPTTSAATAPTASAAISPTASAAIPAPTMPAMTPAAPAAAGPGVARPPVPAHVAGSRAPVSPSARRRARELGIDPEGVHGTGPHESVTTADIEAAALARTPASASAPTPAVAAVAAVTAVAAIEPPPMPAAAVPLAPAAAPVADAATIRQQAMRKAIAAAMSRSKREIPHYYLSEPIPMAAALGWLQQHNAGLPITERILAAALLLKAVAVALRAAPALNGLFRDGTFQPSAAVHTGVAIALRGGGLVAPAIHDVGDRTLEDLMRGLADLVKRARAGSLRSSEMSDPTITVTNLGEQGAEAVFGVIYPPQVALVGFGRPAERPWSENGWIRSMPVVTATLAADHRVSDGHQGARFLAELRDVLQRPETLCGDPR